MSYGRFVCSKPSHQLSQCWFLSIVSLGTNFSEWILIKMPNFSFRNIHLKRSSDYSIAAILYRLQSVESSWTGLDCCSSITSINLVRLNIHLYKQNRIKSDYFTTHKKCTSHIVCALRAQLVQVMPGAPKAASRYLTQWWPSSSMHICLTWLQYVLPRHGGSAIWNPGLNKNSLVTVQTGVIRSTNHINHHDVLHCYMERYKKRWHDVRPFFSCAPSDIKPW